MGTLVLGLVACFPWLLTYMQALVADLVVWEEGRLKWVWEGRRGFFRWERGLFADLQTAVRSFIPSIGV